MNWTLDCTRGKKKNRKTWCFGGWILGFREQTYRVLSARIHAHSCCVMFPSVVNLSKPAWDWSYTYNTILLVIKSQVPVFACHLWHKFETCNWSVCLDNSFVDHLQANLGSYHGRELFAAYLVRVLADQTQPTVTPFLAGIFHCQLALGKNGSWSPEMWTLKTELLFIFADRESFPEASSNFPEQEASPQPGWQEGEKPPVCQECWFRIQNPKRGETLQGLNVAFFFSKPPAGDNSPSWQKFVVKNWGITMKTVQPCL